MKYLAANVLKRAAHRLAQPTHRSVMGLQCSSPFVSMTSRQPNYFGRANFSSSATSNSEDDAATAVLEEGSVLVSYGEGDDATTSLRFPASWLWVNDPAYSHPTSGQRLRTLGNYSPKAHVMVEAAMVPASAVSDFIPPPPGSYHPRGDVYDIPSKEQDEDMSYLDVTWEDGSHSYYHLEWLSQFSRSLTQSTTAAAPSKTRITKTRAIGARENPDAAPIPTMDYSDVMGSEDGLLEAMKGIMNHGAMLVVNSPKIELTPDEDGNLPLDDFGQPETVSDQTVTDLGKRLGGGWLSHGSLYGDSFRVKSVPGAHNIAYTNVELPPHQDLTYYESKPFLQLLHCVAAAPDTGDGGGASVLIDVMAAAEELRKLAPDLFDVLCQVPATFIKQRNGADMVSFKPHIVMLQDEVVDLNWSPPFEGPFVHVEPEMVDDYVTAYQALEILLDKTTPSSDLLPDDLEQKLRDYSSQYTWEKPLQPGEIMIFNNQRMCHGRRAFTVTESGDDAPPRHLIGCYTDAMETNSVYRLLLRKRGNGQATRNVGNGTLGSTF